MVDEIRRVVCEVVIPGLSQNSDKITEKVKENSLKLKKSLSLTKKTAEVAAEEAEKSE